MMDQVENLKNAVKRPLSFLNEAKEELNKVVWPNRDEVTSFTIVVIIAVIMVSLFLWAVDSVLVTFIKMVIR
jgi:preprotein translocase subunit SecE